MNFGETVEALKKGRCVQREGWSGKGMHIYLQDHFPCVVVNQDGGLEPVQRYKPVIRVYTAQHTQQQPGWLASQADILAEDWQLVAP